MMDDDFYSILVLILRDFSFVLGWMLLLASMFIGLVMVLKPGLIDQLNQKMSAGYSLRRSTRFLEVPKYFEPVVYRYHRLTGTLAISASVYVLYYLVIAIDKSQLAQIIARDMDKEIAGILLNAIWLCALLAGISSLIIGIILFIRPSVMKNFESWCNHWFSTRRLARPLDVGHDSVDQIVERHPRIVGIVIITVSLYAAVGLLVIHGL